MEKPYQRSIRTFAALVFLQLGCISATQAGSSPLMGSNAGTSYRLSCPGVTTLRGIHVKFERRNLIYDIRGLCAPTSSRQAQPSSQYTQWAIGAKKKLGPNREHLMICPSTSGFIAAFSALARTVDAVVVYTGISPHCYEINLGRLQSQPTIIPPGPASNGSSFSPSVSACPSGQVASGLRGKANDGYITSMRLDCKPAGNLNVSGQSGRFTWQTRDVNSQDVNAFQLPSVANNKNLSELVSGNIAIRSDGRPCLDCHQSSDLNSRHNACSFLQYFYSANKPNNLNDFFTSWLDRNCPN